LGAHRRVDEPGMHVFNVEATIRNGHSDVKIRTRAGTVEDAVQLVNRILNKWAAWGHGQDYIAKVADFGPKAVTEERAMTEDEIATAFGIPAHCDTHCGRCSTCRHGG
jgi:hypothetical protein